MSSRVLAVFFLFTIAFYSTIAESNNGALETPGVTNGSSSNNKTSLNSSGDVDVNNSRGTTSIVPAEPEPSFLSKAYSTAVQPVINLLRISLDVILLKTKDILRPVAKLVNSALSIIGINDIGGAISNMIRQVATLMAQIVVAIGDALSTGSDFLHTTSNSVSHRGKRSIMGMVGGAASTMVLPITIARKILTFPFSMISEIFDILSFPFRMIYQGLTWPYRMIFGSSSGNMSNTNGTMSSGYIMNFMDGMSANLTKSMVNMMINVFHVFRTSFLPTFDKFLMKYSNSSFLPESVKGYITDFHETYELMHLIGMM